MVIIRSCFLDVFNVPSGSMENTLKPQDLIVINKVLYSGAFSKLLSKININSHPDLNDILVFKIDPSDTTFYVKRCIGLPGKTIKIRNSKVFVNNEYINEAKTALHLYKLWYKDYSRIANALDQSKINLVANRFWRLPGYVMMTLDYAQKKELECYPAIDSITVFGVNENKDSGASRSLLYGKVVQNLKPILIPGIGMKIKLYSQTFALYKDILKNDEKVVVTNKENLFFVNGRESEYYIFKHDYYFMMGDNREMSSDSRAFGFISKDCIEGKVIGKI